MPPPAFGTVAKRIVHCTSCEGSGYGEYFRGAHAGADGHLRGAGVYFCGAQAGHLFEACYIDLTQRL